MKKILNELKKRFFLLPLAVSFIACENDKPAPDPEPFEPMSGGVFILNQGNWGLNNAGISFYDFETEEFYYDITNKSLGDIGQDMIAYGKKLYVSVSESGRISIFDLKSGKHIKSIDLRNGEQVRQPRSMTSYNGKVYVSTLDGNVVRIDTVSLTQDGITPVGPNPEGIAAVNGKLYVANSGGFLPDYVFNNTLSIVDIAGFREEKVLTVGLNPLFVHSDSYGNVFLSYRGNYSDVSAGFQKIDTKTYTVSDISISANQDFVISGDSLYFYGVSYNADFSTNNSFGIYNVKTNQLVTNKLISDNTKINTPYGIGVNPMNKDVYISDTDYANPGFVYIFGTDGKKKKMLAVGVNACKFVFID